MPTRSSSLSMKRLEELRALSRQAREGRDYAAYTALERAEMAILGARHQLLEAKKVLKGDALRFAGELLGPT